MTVIKLGVQLWLYVAVFVEHKMQKRKPEATVQNSQMPERSGPSCRKETQAGGLTTSGPEAAQASRAKMCPPEWGLQRQVLCSVSTVQETVSFLSYPQPHVSTYWSAASSFHLQIRLSWSCSCVSTWTSTVPFPALRGPPTEWTQPWCVWMTCSIRSGCGHRAS